MRKSIFKKTIVTILMTSLSLSLVACGSKKTEDTGSGNQKEEVVVTMDQIKVGEDYTDVKADLKFLTHRTDSIDTKFKNYVEEFQKMYPNVTITYEGITDYANDVTTRLSTGDWGDICMIPTTIDKKELGNYFQSLGKNEDLTKEYNMLNNFRFGEDIYGIPSVANAQGIVYNKAVFEKAGVKEVPKTPDEFIEALKMIKNNTDAIPLYTNFAAGWTMCAWDAYISGSANGDPDYMNEGLLKGSNPFSNRNDGTGPYAVYNILYEAVKQGLTEEDPTTTDWEGSKAMLNNGEIATMVLGSWAISQVQSAGEHGNDIGYMPFPITVNGKQYATAGPDYCYGINVNSSSDNKIAAMCYIKYLVNQSGFALSEGSISVLKTDPLPDNLNDFTGVELVVDNPAKEGEESLFGDVNNQSELGLNVSGAIPTQIVEEATSGTKTMEEMAAEWNKAWTEAQKDNGINP